MHLDIKGLVALVVVIATFIIMGLYAFRGQTPDVAVASIVSGALMAVLGFYFGHINGTASAQLVTAQNLLALAQQRRVTDQPDGPTTPLVPPTVP